MKADQQLDVILNYSSLCKLNPETAMVVILEVFKQTNNISQTARVKDLIKGERVRGVNGKKVLL
ncbi:MAG: hypothetical protein A3F31_01710 [Candidatus Levybacteria bacterium RIFCSPHIGHO2_12_FULL_38_12]|nr:MAG: hypothetical protein A2770_00415 [Candidatus Levybacteria bacterium RIFCSPHIGHO2_01_FULL_38_12]OGH22186.1 MAG: hypothetical protein A3D75_01860 [Candidatus Levybacteria bacterium RIFCSPHIGHO2_02_FULL_37_18]OGH22194.1 MAG: hypothetical protein A3F31_01710 [Candidatus Levybacteria bacterium RIFCSPHIGHO2_12_FULL_38_12]OGH34357.1 MAG: hypothetical protein A3A47_02070 [Candidatus Levybacteria bacterium RIFCSPLOWO2_01_FULL_37_20]OGH44239.1 MAG: hypothetical protein A3J14_01655 [Candidatus Lev